MTSLIRVVAVCVIRRCVLNHKLSSYENLCSNCVNAKVDVSLCHGQIQRGNGGITICYMVSLEILVQYGLH